MNSDLRGIISYRLFYKSYSVEMYFRKKNTVAHSRMNDPVFVGWIQGRLLCACALLNKAQAGVEAVQPRLHHCVLTEGGETWDSSWSGYHCDVMGEAARGRAGGPLRQTERR